ncbi:MAG TPA: hypothetical protein VG244_00665 [Acidimicrobiales bacterium]|nr:hypothetical protein [Acidimicrobiales bacterium]
METNRNLPAMTYHDANAPAMLEFFVFSGRSPFQHPPALHTPLNPFVGRLPVSSSAPGFHPVATPVPADSLLPAKYRGQQATEAVRDGPPARG